MAKQDKVIPLRQSAGRPVTTRGFPITTLRLPPDIRENLLADAERNYMSVNAIVIRCLRIYYNKLKED